MKSIYAVSAGFIVASFAPAPANADRIFFNFHHFENAVVDLPSTSSLTRYPGGQQINLPGDARLGGPNGPQGTPSDNSAASFPVGGGDRALKIGDNNSPFPELCLALSLFGENCE